MAFNNNKDIETINIILIYAQPNIANKIVLLYIFYNLCSSKIDFFYLTINLFSY